MDDGTRIAPEVEVFLRAARAGDVKSCENQLKANRGLVNAVEAGGYAAMHFAAFQGNLEMIALLQSYDCDPHVLNYDGNSPMMLAAKMGRNDSIEALVRNGANVNQTGRSEATAAHHAAGNGHLHTLRLLVSLGATIASSEPVPTGTLLHWGAHLGDVDVVGALLYEFHLPIDAVDSHGGTALFTAIHCGKTELVQFLLEHGANPNIACGPATPLLLAVDCGTLDVVKHLLAFDADREAKDDDGHTALDLAKSHNHAESLKELAKPKPDAAKRAEDALRFKNHGNRVFAEGENVKAAKLYTAAIGLEHGNHIFFSNRSACHFNLRRYTAALWDAERCVALAPTWPKGYLRKAATLKALMKRAEAREACAKGLALEPGNKDLLAVAEELKQ